MLCTVLRVMGVLCEVRPIRPAEYRALGVLTAEVYRAAYPPVDEARREIEKMYDVATRVAETDTTFVGVECGTARILGGVSFVMHGNKHANLARPDEGEFRQLAVDPAARGQGVGRALVRACLDRAAELGLNRVVLQTQTDMLAAQRLYRRMGFSRIPERDTEPVPGIHLWAYAIDIERP